MLTTLPEGSNAEPGKYRKSEITFQRRQKELHALAPWRADLQLHSALKKTRPGSPEAKLCPLAHPIFTQEGRWTRREGTTRTLSPGETGPQILQFIQQETFIEHPLPVSQEPLDSGALFITSAAPLLSLKSRLRPSLEEQEPSPPGDCPAEESTGEEDGPSAAGAPPSCGPETLRPGEQRSQVGWDGAWSAMSVVHF